VISARQGTPVTPGYHRHVGAARYDGIAEWYDEMLGDAELGHFNRDVAVRLLGPGPGRLIDVGCGGGVAAVEFARHGWTVSGIDISDDQLRLARERGVDVVHADATDLPFGTETFDAAVSIGTHTDFDDFPSAVHEVARVLRPGAPFVYVGVHPCFVGPHIWCTDGERPQLHSGYRETNWKHEAPGISGDGLRAKVGVRHLPLDAFLQSFIDGGFQLERFEEPDEREFPKVVALRLRRGPLP
jgi:SAM-dependent methyltransferase